MPIKYVRKLSPATLRNKIVLLRVDLNVKSGDLGDAYRLQAIIPTLKFLKRAHANIIILSHRGRPKGPEPSLSLKPFAKLLSKKLNSPIVFFNQPINQLTKLTKKPINQINQKTNQPINQTIILLENLRFDPREETNDKHFAKELASLGDIYVNDAFAVSHRANASVAAITKFLPSYAGLLLEKEIKNLQKVMLGYKKPLILIVGGEKVEDKAGILKYFLTKADYILLGGGVANTFLKAKGNNIRGSIFDAEADVRPLLKRKNIILPEDDIWKDKKILDIGPRTSARYAEIIEKAKTIIWGGPMGKYEEQGYGKGTKTIWQAILENKKSFSVIGGGETIGSLKLIRTKPHTLVSACRPGRASGLFLSTGGGAMLEFLSSKKLPGIEALKK